MAKNDSKISKKKQLVRLSMSAFLLAGVLANPMAAPAQTLSCPQSFQFGNYSTCASTQTATITPNGTRTVTGCLSAGGAPFSNALCTVTQTFPLKVIVFSVTATKATMSHAIPPDKMTVNAFKCMSASVKCTAASPINSTTFFVSIPIGATMTVSNPQAAGTYNGTFTVNSILQ